MKCRYHPQETAVAVCQKFGVGYCSRCCGTEADSPRCACTSPNSHCRFRQECVVHFLGRKPGRARTPAGS